MLLLFICVNQSSIEPYCKVLTTTYIHCVHIAVINPIQLYFPVFILAGGGAFYMRKGVFIFKLQRTKKSSELLKRFSSLPHYINEMVNNKFWCINEKKKQTRNQTKG